MTALEKRKPQAKSLPSGVLVVIAKTVWTTLWRMMMSQLAPSKQSGEYSRPPSQFRHQLGKEDENPYQPEKGRYRLYVGLSCPWAHRTLMVRTLKGLENVIEVYIVSPSSTQGGWVMAENSEGCHTLAQLYKLAQADYQGRCTVPVFWDKQTKTIVNNESAEIIEILNSQFNQFATNASLDLYPDNLKEKIDQWNEQIYHTLNNGVYRCGFAQTQSAYNEACEQLFTTLDQIEQVLGDNRYLCGDRLTLADIRLFTTLIRFDLVYYGLFKCNCRRISDYQHLSGYVRDLYQLPGVAQTCNLEVVKRDYYGNLFPLNPGGIIPLGPEISSLLKPHGRENLS
jgi:putative glutathione S-transferase